MELKAELIKSKTKKFFLAISSVILLLFTFNASGNTSLSTLLDGLSHITYDSDIPFTIGDTIHVNDLSNPRQRCIEYAQDTVKRDTSGSVNSDLSLRLVRSYEDLENNFNFSFSAHASAKANVAKIVSGESSFTGSGKFERFLRNQSDTMMLVLELNADHGRNLITNFKVSEEFSSLLEQEKVDEFTKNCGTHFVRGWNLKSMVRIMFYMSNLNSNAKTVIETKFKSENKGSGTIKGIGASVESRFSTNLSNILKTASKLGKIEVEVSTIGGQGVETLSQLVSGLDVTSSTEISSLTNAVKEAGKNFTPAPAELIVVPIVGVFSSSPNLSFDAERYESLGGIFRNLMKVDDLLSKYNSYQSQDYSLWNRYFRVKTEKLTVLRNDLANSYASCRNGNSCAYEAPDEIEGIVLDDILHKTKLSAVCSHAFKSNEKINDVTEIQSKYLSSVILKLRSNMRFSPEIDTRGIRLLRITPNLEKEVLDFNHDRQFRSKPITDSEDIVYITVHREKADRNEAYKNQQLNRNYLQNIRRHAARSIYLVEIPFTNGTVVEETLGYPDMKGCSLELSG